MIGQHKQLKRWATRTPTKTGWIQVIAKDKQLLLLIRHSPFYSYLQSSPVIVMAVIKGRRHLREIVKYPLSFEIWIFRNGQCDDERRLFVELLKQWHQPRSNVTLFVSFVIETCKIHTLIILKYCYWRWLLEKWSHHVCRGAFC